MHKAKVRQRLGDSLGAWGSPRQVRSWDKARGKHDEKDNSRASSLLEGSLQPCQKAGGSPVLKHTVNSLEMPLGNCTKKAGNW